MGLLCELLFVLFCFFKFLIIKFIDFLKILIVLITLNNLIQAWSLKLLEKKPVTRATEVELVGNRRVGLSQGSSSQGRTVGQSSSNNRREKTCMPTLQLRTSENLGRL